MSSRDDRSHHAGRRPTLRTPKLLSVAGAGRPSPAARYYAGYDATFVEQLLTHLGLGPTANVLDPWNGAGTTTTVTARSGRPSHGFDINPVLVVIAKSKVLGSDATESRDALTHQILSAAQAGSYEDEPEPLRQWFTDGTAAHIRAIERAIQAVLVDPKQPVDYAALTSLKRVSALAASFYVVLFETVRSFLKVFTSTNPTWMKVSSKDRTRLSVSKRDVDGRFRAVENRMHKHLRQLSLALDEAADVTPEVDLGSSTALPLDADSMDACVSSPPYCTRIDYPVLTRPELAILGIGDDAIMRELRDSSIGTTTMGSAVPEPAADWGEATSAFLHKVKSHPSKASATYYHRYFLQYFDSMHRSLVELRRVLRPCAPCALVVQDSYYKEIHNDLARSLTEMGQAVGWAEVERLDFPVAHTRAAMHPGTRVYRDVFGATESLLVLRD